MQLFRLVLLLALNVLCCAKQFHSLILCTLITGSDRLKSSLRERKQPIINQRFVTFLLKWLATVIYLLIFDQYVLIRYQKCFSFAYDRHQVLRDRGQKYLYMKYILDSENDRTTTTLTVSSYNFLLCSNFRTWERMDAAETSVCSFPLSISDFL